MIKKIGVEKLKEGMILAIDLYDEAGNVLIYKNHILKKMQIEKIESYGIAEVDISLPDIAEEVSVDELIYIDAECERDRVNEIGNIRIRAKNKLKESISEYRDLSGENLDILFDVLEEIINSILESENLLYEIDKLQNSGDYLFNHSINVSILSLLIGISLGYKRKRLESLAKGAIFSDIGKLQIDPKLLIKATNLDVEEMNKIKKYPEYGYSFMKHIEDMDEIALDCILHSREKWNGSGYPNGLKENEISLDAQIVSFSTFFDALCSDRPYRMKKEPYKVMAMCFDEANISFSEGILSKAIKMLGYYYKGMFVQLKTGEIARVSTENRHKPLLTVLQSKNPRVSSHFYEIDMSKNPSVKIRDVLFKGDYHKLLGE